jgi:hypothetical protein
MTLGVNFLLLFPTRTAFQPASFQRPTVEVMVDLPETNIGALILSGNRITWLDLPMF